MGFTIALAALHLVTLALAAIRPDLAEASFTIVQCAMGAVALALPGARKAALAALLRFWPAALAYGLIVVMTLADAGLLGLPANALKPYETRTEAWDLIGLFFGALAAAGAAGYAGRRNVLNALLYCGLTLAALAALQTLQGAGRGLYDRTGEGAVVFTLFAMLALYSGVDELRRRGAAPVGGDRRRISRGRRMVLPVLALLGALNGALIATTASAAAALALGIFLLCVGLAVREQRRGFSSILLASAAGIAFLAGGGLMIFAGEIDGGVAVTTVRDALRAGLHAVGLGGTTMGGGVMNWPGEAGLAGFALLLAAAGLMLAQLAMSVDRNRKPSRAFALMLACFGVMLLAGPGADGPTATATLALIAGLAATYSDALRPRSKRQMQSPD